MAQEPVKLYAAAIIRNSHGKIVLTRHDASSKWHFPDCVPTMGESSWTALKQALQKDFDGSVTSLETQPCQVTEIIAKGIRHVTFHYSGAIGRAWVKIQAPMEAVMVTIDTKLDCYQSTRIVLERLRTSTDRR